MENKPKEQMEPISSAEYIQKFGSPDFNNHRFIKVFEQDLSDYISARSIEKPPFTNKGTFYQAPFQQERVVEPEFDFHHVFMFYHNEPMIEQSIKKRVSLMFKNGWKIVGTKNRIVNYLNRRLNEICAVNETTMEMFMKEIVENLYKYSNCFLIKKRSQKHSSGTVRKTTGDKKIEPIATYQIVSPLVMKPKVNKFGEIIEWQQYAVNSMYQKIAEFSPRDVVHLAINKETGFIWGKPLILSVVPDVEALRRIEENLQMLIAQHIFPLYHYSVGTEERPATHYPDGTNEVDVVQRNVQSLPTQGVVFTPERHKILPVSKDSVVDVSSYLEYFANRVYLGLGVSSVDLGLAATANRATAVTISQSLKDAIEGDQQMFSELFQVKIIKELLLEASFSMDIFDALQDIRLRFATIDIDEKIKYQNHAMTLYLSGMLTHNEARDEIDMENITEDQILNETMVGLKFKMDSFLKTLAPPATLATTKTGGGEAGAAVHTKHELEPSPIEGELALGSQALFKKGQNISRPENKEGTKLSPKRMTNEEENSNLTDNN